MLRCDNEGGETGPSDVLVLVTAREELDADAAGARVDSIYHGLAEAVHVGTARGGRAGKRGVVGWKCCLEGGSDGSNEGERGTRGH